MNKVYNKYVTTSTPQGLYVVNLRRSIFPTATLRTFSVQGVSVVTTVWTVTLLSPSYPEFCNVSPRWIVTMLIKVDPVGDGKFLYESLHFNLSNIISNSF